MTKKTKNSIPFSFNPKGWFLKGKEKERAKANTNYPLNLIKS